MGSAIDQFLGHAVWRNTHRARLISIGESANSRRYSSGDLLFKQFHPADQLFLLCSGSVRHETSGDAYGNPWPMGQVSWRWGALGWSGFLPPHRNGTTARADTNIEALTWRHEDLARIFYADPSLAVDFFRIVLDSVRRQFERIRRERFSAQTNPSARSAIPVEAAASRHRLAPGLLTALQRSAFFQQFEDAALERLASEAVLVRCEAGTELIRQDADTEGLWVLAAGDAVGYFSGAGGRLERFRTIPRAGGILAGIPTIDGGYRAEATVHSTSACWFYKIPAESIEQFIRNDPEFGRSYMQRHLARLAHLISAARPPKPVVDTEPEIAGVRSILDHNQARIPVTSELHKVPHLLSNRMTIGNAFACLNTAAETGQYDEQAIARTCRDLLTGIEAELRFYRDVLDAYVQVTDAPETITAAQLRVRCDEQFARAFDHLHTEVRGIERLPRSSGHIVIMNHLSCPAYYELPNNYHLSFDTAFVSALLSAHYRRSPVRVVRQSPGEEYGHNLFYGRLGHITVPTIDSGIEATSSEDFGRLRRRSAETLFRRGRQSLAAGENVLICPEGQSQEACNSPAKFYSGAFRLALKAVPEPYIIPIAIAGFDQRYKHAKLVAVIQKPFRLSQALRRHAGDDLRAFLDHYRELFAAAVIDAKRICEAAPRAAESAQAVSTET